MSLSLWPPNPMPPIDTLILIVVAVGGALAIYRFVSDLRQPTGSVDPTVIEPGSNPPPTAHN